MSWRALHDTVGRSESLAALDDLAERLYWRLLAHSDAYGRLRATPAKLRATCYPLLTWTDDDVADALEQLEHARRVRLYTTPDGLALELVDFDDNQPGELKRRRGTPKIPAPTNSGTTPGLANATYRKTPAHEHHSGTTPGHSGTMRAQRRGEETRQEHQQGPYDARETGAVGEPRARVTPPADADGASTSTSTAQELGELLELLGVTGGLRLAALADTDRAIACARSALERDGVTNRAGYFRRLLEAGEWPAAPPASTSAAPAPPLPAVERIGRMIARGVLADLVDLEAELRAGDVDELTAARLRALLEPSASGQETHEPSSDAPSAELEHERTAPGHHAAELEHEPGAGDEAA